MGLFDDSNVRLNVLKQRAYNYRWAEVLCLPQNGDDYRRASLCQAQNAARILRGMRSGRFAEKRRHLAIQSRNGRTLLITR